MTRTETCLAEPIGMFRGGVGVTRWIATGRTGGPVDTAIVAADGGGTVCVAGAGTDVDAVEGAGAGFGRTAGGSGLGAGATGLGAAEAGGSTGRVVTGGREAGWAASGIG